MTMPVTAAVAIYFRALIPEQDLDSTFFCPQSIQNPLNNSTNSVLVFMREFNIFERLCQKASKRVGVIEVLEVGLTPTHN